MAKKKNQLDHLAIIMDGNGRWAKERHLPRFVGHREGMENIRRIALAADDLGIKVLTLYAFSTENWARPKAEVDYLMNLPIHFFDHYMPELMAHHVKVNIMGFLDELPPKTYQVTQKAMAMTAQNSGMILNFAFNYGARREIVTAVKQLVSQVQTGTLSADDIDEQHFSKALMTHQFGDYQDPDLLLRTSGEQRLSNFLLWQLAYTELSFTKKYWPDFTKEDLIQVVKDYQMRDRRFGQIESK